MTLPAGLWPRVERQESGGNPNAVSPKGAWGVAQLMPGTTVDPGFGVKPFNFSAPDPVAENRRVGQDYLAAMVNRYGDVPTALVAYNWGPGNADKWVKGGRNFSALPAETQGYVKNILGGPSSMMEPMRLGPPDSGGNNVPGLLDTQNQDIAGLLEGLGRPQSTLGTSLLNLGAGIASGASQGWGAGIGRGLALAGNAQQEAEANNLRRQALGYQVMQDQENNGLKRMLYGAQLADAYAPEVKNIKLPNGQEVTVQMGKDGSVSPIDTSGIDVPESQFAIPDPKDRAGVEAGLRKEFTGLSGDFIKVRDSYGKIQEAAKAPSAAGDLALIFNYMRLLDPGSTVREGEFATAQNSSGVPDRIRSVYNQVINGQRLVDTQRQDFVTQAKNLFGAQQRQYKGLSDQFKTIAKNIGVDVRNVVPDFSLVPGESTPSEAARQSNQALPGGATEEDIQHTMKVHNLTREQVLERLQ